MKVLITGATGLIGTRLIKQLIADNISEINILTRNPQKTKKTFPLPVNPYAWDPAKGTIDQTAFENVDVVINLAGEGIADSRWDAEKKKRILDSRVNSTSLLIKTIKDLERKPKKLISASAIGFYGDRASEKLDANSPPGNDFLADVCKQWESLALNHNIPELKSHCLRIGFVLAKEGGALTKMLTPFKLGIGGPLGSGKQYMSWIHIQDLVRQFVFLVNNELTESIFNGVSPHPITNKKFTQILAKTLHRPALFPVPKLALKVVLGEMAEVVLAGQRVLPKNFQTHGFKYQFADLNTTLKDILGD